ncbi:hypothetical protein Nepgr_018125 [Nepenthes gracilis]|uniref:Uncharacterized protein n=1 Tax=Nepenthes gracilis TaxID=150966 RepID=A0AAD3SSV5_NEPGR|nr:hypothetical protein Nepgr_018125 [Nepenthes gracilis]
MVYQPSGRIFPPTKDTVDQVKPIPTMRNILVSSLVLALLPPSAVAAIRNVSKVPHDSSIVPPPPEAASSTFLPSPSLSMNQTLAL